MAHGPTGSPLADILLFLLAIVASGLIMMGM